MHLPPHDDLRTPAQQLLTWQPPAPLRAFILDICDLRELIPPDRRELPGADLNLILSLGPRLRIENPDAGTVERRSFLVGLHDTASRTTPLEGSVGIQLRLHPLSAARLLNLPLHLLHNRCPSAEDLLGPDFTALEDRLSAEPQPQRRFNELARALQARLLALPAAPAEVAWAVNTLRAARGDLPIQHLTEQLGWSRRRLRDAFLRYVGVGPKHYARLLRFERAVEELRRGATLLDAALDAGFSDQAHMNRDFRAFAGQPPGALRRGAG
jgi:AraC-like DNA-binding protein